MANHSHQHLHGHHHHGNTSNLKLAFFLNLGFTILEIIGGLYVNSVAILSDAVHDLGDSLSLGIAWFLQNKSNQKANKEFSFGYKRFSLLGALINSIVLIVGSVYVVSDAVERLIHPQYSNANGMLLIAIVGIAVNGYAAYKVSKGHTLNERVISWHLVEDVLGWIAILVASIILKFWDTPYLDPCLSLLITLFILWNVTKRLKETLFLFLQGKPHDIDIDKLEKELLSISFVSSVHHSHIWSLDGEKHVFSTHVKLKEVKDLTELKEIKETIKNKIAKYPFEHYTVETELEGEYCVFEEEE